MNYFKEMLSGDVSERAVYAHSSFEPDNKRIVVATDVTSRYTRRNVREYAKVHDYIMHMISGRSGRYMVFFPSYSYMESVLECFRWKVVLMYRMWWRRYIFTRKLSECACCREGL